MDLTNRVARGASILVVDDNELNRDALSCLLRLHQYEVEAAADGQAALSLSMGTERGNAAAPADGAAEGGGGAAKKEKEIDLLEAGIEIMAQPPGKKNTTVDQLSGGEKALTAVALVFSIFELNPAPFCLLDEVDAPLDENNVGRFCEIVREMSERVQFIFVTHNKTTMEMANQLVGVTQNEPGCSRLVAVDVDEAVRWAAG